MTDAAPIALTEDELDVLVSIAIRRAEILDEAELPAAGEAWREVTVYEQRLAALTRPEEIPGGVARVGAVAAALAAGERDEAARLAGQYFAEHALPFERRAAIERVFHEDHLRLAQRFPALAKSGVMSELGEWRVSSSKNPRVFPRAA